MPVTICVPPSDTARLLRLALLAEAVLATVTAFEAAAVATAFGAVLPVLLTAAVSVSLFVAARSAGRGRAGRWVRRLQWAFLAVAALDVVVAGLVSAAPPPLVPALVRVALPVTVLVLARRAVLP